MTHRTPEVGGWTRSLELAGGKSLERISYHVLRLEKRPERGEAAWGIEGENVPKNRLGVGRGGGNSKTGFFGHEPRET